MTTDLRSKGTTGPPDGPTRVAAYQRLTQLPTFPPTAMRLLTLSTEADTALADFERIFKADVTLTADLLLTANSAAYGLRSRVESIRHALTLVGLERVRSLACNIMWRGYLRRQSVEHLQPIWRHSIAAAVIGEILGTIYHVPGLYTAGLLHDLGRLGLLLSAGESYEQVLTEGPSDIEQAMERELDVCGMSHCDAGALLAQTWGFPELLQVTMVEHHGQRPVTSGSPVGLIQTACRMADWLGFPEFHAAAGAVPILPARVQDAPQLAPERLCELIIKQTSMLS
jgi:HD-like signal output (HDOD) protein